MIFYKTMNRDLVITSVDHADIPELISLNSASTPHVNRLAEEELNWLISQSAYVSIARSGSAICGFILALRQGKAYQSQNYRWFNDRYEDFIYIDRIVVSEECRGRGIGNALYDGLEDFSRPKSTRLACEVNVVPPNPTSLRFHEKRGFKEIGQQDTEGGKKRVSLLMKQL